MENHWSKSSFLQSEPCTWRVSRSGESFRTSSTHPLHWQVEDVEDVVDDDILLVEEDDDLLDDEEDLDELLEDEFEIDDLDEEELDEDEEDTDNL